MIDAISTDNYITSEGYEVIANAPGPRYDPFMYIGVPISDVSDQMRDSDKYKEELSKIFIFLTWKANIVDQWDSTNELFTYYGPDSVTSYMATCAAEILTAEEFQALHSAW